MNHLMSGPLLLLLSLLSIVHCRNCKWLQPKQEYLNIQILQTFSQLTPPKDSDIVCHDYPTAQPDLERLYDIKQVEAAALAVREVLSETIRFYRKHHESMGCKQQAWERFQQLLYYQLHQLEGCVPETGEDDLLKNKISSQFQQLEKYVAEQDKASCAWDFIQDEIRRNLHLALQLSSRLRRQHLL